MRYTILAIIGLVMAAAVVMVLQAGSQAPQTPAYDGDKVLIAKTELLPGNFIVSANHIDFKDMDKDDIKPNFIQKKDIDAVSIEGAVVRNNIKPGEPIQRDKIVTPKEGGFLSAVLYPGKRAISVGVNVVSANAGFIFPGDKVDLLLTHEIDTPDGRRSFATETFVENVRVLAIDQQVNNPDNKALVPKTVTLEVSPKQAESILVAGELGKISLILRASGLQPGQTDEAAVGTTYTKDNEVSRVIQQYTPNNDGGVDVTITRGKSTIETKVSPGREAGETPAEPAAPITTTPAPGTTTTLPPVVPGAVE